MLKSLKKNGKKCCRPCRITLASITEMTAASQLLLLRYIHMRAQFCFLDTIHSYEVTSTKYTRDIYKELLVALVASLFMGFGVLFLLLWVGIYV